ncbi:MULTISPECIES: tryptophan synthase subunit alpha [Legionella]|uniref:Tryptophan synthase alpha chain n=1 Tax=Legionella septentrionalis TaxID=2498109 RepID=A0A433JH91_9GAMM|nr:MULTISPECIES: tryptophan synthase subunit alpha [Legionella]MCP0913625.1 tryptophan synthase subunit alpha [Legionella sp. 27cVA30]RUQ81633.1 tryptophan synthase subunit alpha [Legionella septentrionalis]RUQ96346.1 tryptophan synthase subunit alpha [Legionella septentrionalis]RUR09081.1 tryptophan synthase subunit alpha [Legionella septentrionalis]RUR14142.1 tryptophan synthase subunit alpha [Legionella septentrionalis]
MNRIDHVVEQLKTANKKILSPYITAGDPEPSVTVDLMHALVAAGADILEIGLPFSDPMAEGPVIQAAMERALAHHVTCDDVFAMVQQFRKKDNKTPIVLMGYVNPIEQYGYERFAKQAQLSGIDATIIVDLPPEESGILTPFWPNAGLYNIYLCSPTTSDERMRLINHLGRGYLYYVSLKGVTGADTFDLNSVKKNYKERKTQTELPVMVGFGIKTPEIAAQVAQFADGVIVGAALISQVLAAHTAGKNPTGAAAAFINKLREAMDT